MNHNKKNKQLKFITALILLLFILLFILWNQDLTRAIGDGDIEAIRNVVADNLLSSYLLTLILMIIQNSFTLIPLILIITLNFTLFGFVSGSLWGWLCSVFAASLIFLSVKHFFQERLLSFFKLEFIQAIERKGFSYVLQARIFPFIPTSFINILAGLSSIRFKDFFWATALGNFFYFFILMPIPAGFFSSGMNKFTWGIIIILVFIFFHLLKRKYKQKQNKFLLQSSEQKQNSFQDH